MSNITIAPVIVNSLAKTSTERKMDVLQFAGSAVIQAHVNDKGAIGKACRESFANGGLIGIARAASNANYLPLAQHMYLTTGKPVVIGSRNGYLAITDTIDAMILAETSKKNGGFREDKNGLQVPTASHAALLKLRSDVVDIQAEAEAIFQARKQAKADALAIEAKQLANEQQA